VCVDLSKYAGQKVYIAFRNYITEYTSTSTGSMLSQWLYIDNVTVNAVATSDLALTSLSAFKNGTISSQPVTVGVVNYGLAVDGFDVAYKIGDAAEVTEHVATPLASGESTTYTFNTPAQFANVGSQEIVARVVNEQDPVTVNNSASAKVNVLALSQLPYTMDPETASTDLISTLSGTTKRPAGWMYFSDYKAWVYTQYSTTTAQLYPSKAFSLPAGKVKITASYTSVSETASLTAHLTHDLSDFGTAVGKVSLPLLTDDEKEISFVIDVPEAGDYIIGLSVEGASANDQVKISALNIAPLSETPDVAVKEITSPSAGLLVDANVAVSAKIENGGGATAKGITAHYQINNGAVVSENVSDIDALITLDYTFATKADLSTEGAYTLKVWADCEQDTNAANDTISLAVNAYAPRTLPWADSFESTSERSLWTVVNTKGDATAWYPSAYYTFDGAFTMYLNGSYTATHDDWLISPALKITGSEPVRFSFYYSNLLAYEPETAINVYLLKSPSVDDLTNAVLVKSIATVSTQLKYESVTFDAPAEGVYYLAIQALGGGDELIIDDVRLDRNNELAVVGVTLDAVENGYDLEPAGLKTGITNYGSQVVTDVTATAVVYLDGDATAPLQTISEVIPTIGASSTLDYAFNSKINFVEPGAYNVVVTILHSQDADLKNNSFVVDGPTVYPTKDAPCVIDFEEKADRDAIISTGRFTTSANSPYEGYYGLCLSGKSTDQEKGDNVFLNRVYMKKGTYQLSFFWSTTKGQTAERYQRSFTAYLCKSATAEAMTTPLVSIVNGISADKLQTKEVTTFTIEEDGCYFIGFNCLNDQSLGNLFIDYVRIDNVEAGQPVGGENKYEASAETINGTWEKYHPLTANQWAASDDKSYLTVDEYNQLDAWYLASYLASPALSLTAGTKYSVSAEYAVLPYSGSTLAGTNALKLSVGTVDNPRDYTVIASGADDSKTMGNVLTVSTEFTPTVSGNHYFAVRPSSTVDATYRLYSFSVVDADASGVSDVAVDNQSSGFVVEGSTIRSNGDSVLEVYSISGALVARSSGTITLPAGVYIVVAGTTAQKVIIP
jgi:hypothetical protein